MSRDFALLSMEPPVSLECMTRYNCLNNLVIGFHELWHGANLATTGLGRFESRAEDSALMGRGCSTIHSINQSLPRRNTRRNPLA